MCINFLYYPLVKDSITNKQRVLFTSPFTLNDYDDLRTIGKDAWFRCIDKKRIAGMCSTERFVKLLQIPCGYCTECLNSKAKSTTFRIMKELSEHDDNWFVTLTYDDDHLPANYSLVKDEISNFNKKLKVYLSRKGMKSDFRFYGVGEYGGQTARPHYHVIYFGLPLDDLVLYSKNDFGQPLYNSAFLSKVWAKGHVVLGEVDIASAAYVARYTEKKQNQSKEEKEKLIALGFVPEYSRQSMNPGIGFNYFSKVVVSIDNGCYNENVKGTSFSFPKYYTDRYKQVREYSPQLLALENRNQVIQDSRASSILLSYGPEYWKILKKEDEAKKSNKNKRRL